MTLTEARDIIQEEIDQLKADGISEDNKIIQSHAKAIEALEYFINHINL